MHNRDKYPEIWTAFEAANAELAPLLAERATHNQRIGKLQEKIEALRVEKVAVNDEAMKDAPRIAELRDTVARMAKAMGARTASGG